MDEPKHTPGPWKVIEHEGWFGIAHSDGWVLESNDENQDRIDARLMAESPEMFKVVQRFATVDWMGEKELSALIKECRAIVERVNRHG
jgi:hypothetical protein